MLPFRADKRDLLTAKSSRPVATHGQVPQCLPGGPVHEFTITILQTAGAQPLVQLLGHAETLIGFCPLSGV